MAITKTYPRASLRDWKAYWQFPEKGYPQRIYWMVIAPKGTRLTFAQETELVFDERDYKIRGLKVPEKEEDNA